MRDWKAGLLGAFAILGGASSALYLTEFLAQPQTHSDLLLLGDCLTTLDRRY